MDRSVDMGALVAALNAASNFEELRCVMSPYLSSSGAPLLSLRFMCSLLSRLPDWRRSLALLDWMTTTMTPEEEEEEEEASNGGVGRGGPLYPPSLAPFNVVLRNACRAGALSFACALLLHMRAPPLSLVPDAFSYSTLLSALSSDGEEEEQHHRLALSLLPLMRADAVRPDLVLYSTLMSLSLRLRDPSRALALFSRLRAEGIAPDLRAFNAALAALCALGLLRDARRLLLSGMPAASVAPDASSYAPLLSALVRRRRFLAALSLFSHMRAARVRPDLPVLNIALHAYGRLGLARDADRLFWSMRRHLGVDPGLVTYNTMLRRKAVPQNAVTYNTMIALYARSLEHEKAANLMHEMRRRGIAPDAVTYSTVISVWAKAGKLDRAAKLFQKLRDAGAEIDPVLYQTMIVVYERAGLVGHARRLLHDLRHAQGAVPKATAVKILAGAGRLEEAAWVFRQALDAGEAKDVSVFKAMIDLFSRNRKHRNVVEVFDKMRAAGYSTLFFLCPFPLPLWVSLVRISSNQFSFGKKIKPEPEPEPELELYPILKRLPESKLSKVLIRVLLCRSSTRPTALYKEMQEEGCIFCDRVHFQMLSLLGARRDFEGMESLLAKLSDDPNIDKKELQLVAAGVYERANKLDEASRIIEQIKNSNSSDDGLDF
ncbi:Pentatricopeptide repeat-containing protein, chloroplastic [Ananas comosus]|uniref:Pentatricopeptide repeat-containing protein, chloroplastic n=1 Tax=Ananas comosus TaxID=4615 RepID=A0A199W2S0_ANACO|nr:Pentatricopeptide repeat-containing protein, chloroplastic [Ananas comosus]